MNKRYVLIISVALAVIAAALILFFVIKGKNGGEEIPSDVETVYEEDDGNWTSIYEATPVD